jgi:hypothetical protein
MATETANEGRRYTDLHEHIEALRAAGLLVEIDRKINKDPEMHPLVRWQSWSAGWPATARFTSSAWDASSISSRTPGFAP